MDVSGVMQRILDFRSQTTKFSSLQQPFKPGVNSVFLGLRLAVILGRGGPWKDFLGSGHVLVLGAEYAGLFSL